MNKLKSFTSPVLTFVFVIGFFSFLPSITQSQIKYDVKLIINDKVLFTNCVFDGYVLYIPMEELALKIDGSISIESPYKLGPYFSFKKSKVSLIKTGSGNYAELNVKKTGVLSSEVKIIILDGKKHAFIDIESFSIALGGTWTYNESTGIYGVTVGGCGACLIEILS